VRSARQVLVISLQKTGTHLMQGLMVQLGYKMAGVPRPEPANIPHFDAEQRARIAALVLSEADHKELLTWAGTEEFERRTDEAWAALIWDWQRRLGQRVVNRYGQARYDFADRVISNDYLSHTRFADTPEGICWIFHELDLERVDGTFLAEWVQTKSPPIVFNYRDPRDTLVSLVNFLEGRTAQGYGNFYEFDVYHDILATKGSWEEKLDYAMRDPAFLGHDEFARSLWLLNHPAVCKVRYEDLAGPRGGGTAEAQLDAVSRLVRHIDCDADPREIAARVYDPGSWSFHQGRIGAWRDHFTERNLARFREQFGDILEQYGYE
jgi:hypothetical protein